MRVYQLQLFLGIVVLMLLLRTLAYTPEALELALFACISAPAMHALTYYSAKPFMKGRFVRVARPKPERLWAYEAIAMIAGYAMGLLVFVALYGSLDLKTYTLAYAIVQAMRFMTALLVREVKSWGVDPNRPLIALLISTCTAVIAFLALAPFLS